MQIYLNDLLMTIKDFNIDEKKKILETISKCFTLRSYKYVGRKSIDRRKKRKPNTKSGAIITGSLSDEDKGRLTRELLYEYPDRYEIKYLEGIIALFEELSRAKNNILADDVKIAYKRFLKCQKILEEASRNMKIATRQIAEDEKKLDAIDLREKEIRTAS